MHESRELPRVADGLQVEQHRIGVGVVLPVLEEVVAGHLRPVARRHDAGHPEAAIGWLRAITFITAPVILLAHIILTRLIAMIDDVRAGRPFAGANAARLRLIAWTLLAIQLLDLAFGLISIRASEQTGEYFGWSFGMTGWLAVLLLFVLARVFEGGAAMQDELEQTI